LIHFYKRSKCQGPNQDSENVWLLPVIVFIDFIVARSDFIIRA